MLLSNFLLVISVPKSEGGAVFPYTTVVWNGRGYLRLSLCLQICKPVVTEAKRSITTGDDLLITTEDDLSIMIEDDPVENKVQVFHLYSNM